MKLKDIPGRKIPAYPWEAGDKIPWNDPDFSSRMLQNHLSQDHDWASRRQDIIGQHVSWLSQQLPDAKSRILDLGCGPGFYTHKLAGRGHECVGIDFSPASIAYARQQAEKDDLPIEYILADIRDHDIDGEFDLVMMTFGEINVFKQQEAANILARASAALKRGGLLVVEVHTFEEVQRQGQSGSSWQAAEHGLFSERPHVCLQENFWDESCNAAIARFLVIDAVTAEVREYGATTQAYSDAQYLAMFEKAGMISIRKLSPVGWPAGDIFEGKLELYVCQAGLEQ